MGISGLFGYLSRDPENFSDFELHNTYIVIDAENYINHAYGSSKLARHYGGEYLNFTSSVRTFLELLLKCRVKPIFIFDGCHEASGSKSARLKDRLESSIKDLSDFYSTYEGRNPDSCESVPGIMPRLNKRILIEILGEYKIQHLCCEREADKQIAELAVYLDCPVLSNDTDFYFFQSPTSTDCRIVPLEWLGKASKRRSNICPNCPNMTTGCQALPCRLFVLEKSSLRSIPKPLRPLLPVIHGNDITDGLELPAGLRIAPKWKYPGMSYNGRKIHVIIQWLSSPSIDPRSAVTKLLATQTSMGSHKAILLVLRCIDSYLLNPSITGPELCNLLSPIPSTRLSGGNINSLILPTIVVSTNTSTSLNAMEVIPSILTGKSVIQWEERDNDELFSGWPHKLITVFRHGHLFPSMLDALYVRGGCFLRGMFEILSKNESIHSVADKLRCLHYGLQLKLESRLEQKTKLVGLIGNSVIENVRQGRRLIPIKRVVPDVQLDTDISVEDNIRSLFREQLNLDLLRDSSFTAEERALASILVYQNLHSAFERKTQSFQQDPTALAFITCAMVSQNQLGPLLDDSVELSLASSDLSQHYDALCIDLRDRCSASGKSGYSSDIVHEWNELQLVYHEMRQLVTLLVVLCDTDVVLTAQQLSDPSYSKVLQFWSSCVLFPSGKLHFWLSQWLQTLAPKDRWSELQSEWVVKLFVPTLCKSSANVKATIDKIQRVFTLADRMK